MQRNVIETVMGGVVLIVAAMFVAIAFRSGTATAPAGYQVTAIDVQRDAGALLTRLYPRPDSVFNALHGRYGEDGCIQGLLNILDVPYTHSGLLASAIAASSSAMIVPSPLPTWASPKNPRCASN